MASDILEGQFVAVSNDIPPGKEIPAVYGYTGPKPTTIKVQATVSMASDTARRRVKNIQMDVAQIDRHHAWVALCAYIIENIGRKEMAQVVYDYMLGQKPKAVRVTGTKYTFDFFNQEGQVHDRFTVQFVEL